MGLPPSSKGELCKSPYVTNMLCETYGVLKKLIDDSCQPESNKFLQNNKAGVVQRLILHVFNECTIRTAKRDIAPSVCYTLRLPLVWAFEKVV
jgi:hypothetical protein